MILNSFSKKKMKALNKISFPDLELPMNLKTLWIETLDFNDVINDVRKDLHTHPFFEAHFMFSGDVTYSWDNNLFEIKSGQAFVMPAKKEHRFIKCSEDIIKTTIIFSADSLIFTEAKIFDFNEEMIRKFTKIFTLSEEDNVFVNHIISFNITEILYSVLQNIAVELPPSSATNPDPRFLVAKRFIENNIDKKITCLQIANECYLSQKQLNRIFSKETGKSISNYINYVKIKTAKKMLCESDFSVKEICYKLGFENESNFITFFKKHCSKTPNAFRKEMSEK